MNKFTIKDLENISGIRAHTIRIWEQRYNLITPDRTLTNIRSYDNTQLKILLNVAILNKYGFKISNINRMKYEEMNERILEIHHLEAQTERVINNLIKEMIDMNIDEFEYILDNYIYTKGIEKSITQIIFPFLEKIGILWLTNHINPAQEHLITNIIRQKIITGIESIPNITEESKKKALLFLPEGQHHELGLLFIFYLLKRKNVKVFYLGADIPLEDVLFVADVKKPNFIYSHLTALNPRFDIEKLLTKIQDTLGNHEIIMSGHFTTVYKKKEPKSITFKKSLQDVISYINKL